MLADDATGCLFEELDDATAAALTARIPARKSDFATGAFWRSRYDAEAHATGLANAAYDWYSSLSAATFVAEALLHGARLALGDVVLHVGCGTSSWGPLLQRLGCCVLDTDIDPALLARLARGRMRRTTCSCEHVALSALRPALRPGCVDCVVDKGTLDALCAGGFALADRAVEALISVLSPGGTAYFVSARPAELLCGILCLGEREWSRDAKVVFLGEVGIVVIPRPQ